MQFIISRLLLLIIIFNIIGLTSCEYISGGADNLEPPQELTKITSEKELKKIWSAKVGGGDYAEYLKLKPLIIADKIYTVDARGRLQARNNLTGDEIWAKQLNKKVSAGLSGDKNKLFMATADGYVLSLNSNSGEIIWQYELDKNILNIPLYKDKDLYIQTTDGTLYSMSAANGKVNWEYKAVTPDLTLYSTSTPVVWNNLVVAGFSSGKIIAFDRVNGMPKWEYQVAVPQGRSSIARMVDINASPLVDNDILYTASYQGKIVAIDLDSGSEKWQFDLSVINDFVINNKYLYVSDTEGTVWAINKSTGRILWRQQNLHMRELSGTSLVNNTILVGDYDGYIHGLSDYHGGFIARNRVAKSGIRVAPTVKNDIIYILDNSGYLSAYKLA